MCFPPSFFTISLMFLLLTRHPEHHLKCFWEVLMRLWRISMEIFRRQTSFGNFKIYFLCQGTHQLDVSHIFEKKIEKKRINMKNGIKFHLKIFPSCFLLNFSASVLPFYVQSEFWYLWNLISVHIFQPNHFFHHEFSLLIFMTSVRRRKRGCGWLR